jgi:hypothetical protein
MKKKNESHVVEAELIPSADMILRSGLNEAALKRMVEQKVAETMAERDALVFEPFFRSRQVAYELKRLQSVPEQRKWSVSFERYGCMICETRKRIHLSNGMCTQCHSRWFRRLTQIILEGINGQAAPPSRRALLKNGPGQDDAPNPQALLPVTSRVHKRWNMVRARNTKGDA